jgi:hypothetical protein
LTLVEDLFFCVELEDVSELVGLNLVGLLIVEKLIEVSRAGCPFFRL